MDTYDRITGSAMKEPQSNFHLYKSVRTNKNTLQEVLYGYCSVFDLFAYNKPENDCLIPRDMLILLDQLISLYIQGKNTHQFDKQLKSLLFKNTSYNGKSLKYRLKIAATALIEQTPIGADKDEESHQISIALHAILDFCSYDTNCIIKEIRPVENELQEMQNLREEFDSLGEYEYPITPLEQYREELRSIDGDDFLAVEGYLTPDRLHSLQLGELIQLLDYLKEFFPDAHASIKFISSMLDAQA